MILRFHWRWYHLALIVLMALAASGAHAQVLRYHAGTDFADPTGVWKADTAITSAGAISSRGSGLEQTVRWGVFSYKIPVAPGDYKVVLHFQETNFTAAGKRLFAYSIQGKVVETGLDVYEQAGAQPFVRGPVYATSDGTITIDFRQGTADMPMVSAVEITPMVVVIPPPPAVQGPPKCRPWPLDMSSTGPHPARANGGFAVAWFCNNKYSWSQEGFSGHESELDADWLTKLADAMTSASVFDSLWTSKVKTRETDPALLSLFASLKGYQPEAPRYVVAANGSSLTRPTYPTTAGVRGTTSNGRVLTGIPCGCAALALEGSSLYCSVAGNDNASTTAVDQLVAGTVSICVKQ